MKHVSTEYVENATRLHYLDTAHDDPMLFDLDLSRIWMGITYPEIRRQTGHGYACVIGERLYRSQGAMRDERVYLVLDEAEATTANALFDHLITLKDRYRLSMGIAPKAPVHLAEAIQRVEGLTFYKGDMHPLECKSRWDSFVDKSVRMGIRTVDLPGPEAAHRGLENLLSTHARDPNTGHELTGSDGKPIPRLYLPRGFKNGIARTEIRQEAMPEVAQALFIVLDALERSRPKRSSSERRDHHIPNPITGY